MYNIPVINRGNKKNFYEMGITYHDIWRNLDSLRSPKYTPK